MIARRQLAVASPISGASLVRSAVECALPRERTRRRAHELVRAAFDAKGVLLTESGTSALTLALRLAAPRDGRQATIGLPAYGCVDLVAAALFAGVRVRVYDIDPATLSPDLDAVRRMIRRGVDAIVVAHLFGYAADVAGVRELASPSGVVVIEDAAQGAGGTLHGARLGALGELAVASFGRGKGLCAAGGGALIANDPAWGEKLNALTPRAPTRGWTGLAATVVQWMLGRPSVYAVPSAIPWLHLGEMVYHPASEPGCMSAASTALVASALALEEKDLSRRRDNARRLDALAGAVSTLAPVTPIASSQPGYLRYALHDHSGTRLPDARQGIVKPYPGCLAEYPQTRPVLLPGEPVTPGAQTIARALVTLPTHAFVRASDLEALGAWMRSAR